MTWSGLPPQVWNFPQFFFWRIPLCCCLLFTLDHQIKNKFIAVIHNPLNLLVVDLPGVASGWQVWPAQCGAAAPHHGDDVRHRAHPVLHPVVEPRPQGQCCKQYARWGWMKEDTVSTIDANWFLPGSQRGLKMEIVFKRCLVNDLLTTYLPSFLLLLLSYATTFFKPIYFEAAVTVNLSILLVITTLFVRWGNMTTENPLSL